MTDIHLRVNQDTGDVMAFDDDDNEVTRVVIEEWIGNTQSQHEFYKNAAFEIRKLLYAQNANGKPFGNTLGIIMPYSFVLEDENGENIEELYIADTDNDTLIIGEPFMEGLTDDLDNFIKDLLDE